MAGSAAQHRPGCARHRVASSTSGADKVELYRAFEVASRNGRPVHSVDAGLLPPEASIHWLRLMPWHGAIHVCHVDGSGLNRRP
jgi:hypothetical protein